MLNERAGRGGSVSQPAPTPHTPTPGEVRSPAANDSAKSVALNGPKKTRTETWRFTDPYCGANALLYTRAPHRDDPSGPLTTKVWCFGHHGGASDVAQALGISMQEVLAWPPPEELGEPVERTGGYDGPPEALHQADEFAKLVRLLRRSRAACAAEARAAAAKRGIDVAQHPIGLTVRRGEPAFVVRTYLGGAVQSEAFRRVNDKAANARWGHKDDVLRGRKPPGWLAYPPQAGRGVLLCAGFWDVLVARELGLPAISSVGTHVAPELLRELAGREVFVCFDVGEEVAAERVARLLRAAEARRAHVLHLPLPCEGDDLNAWFVTYGRSADELKELAREARRVARSR
jgi:hypothetical protein